MRELPIVRRRGDTGSLHQTSKIVTLTIGGRSCQLVERVYLVTYIPKAAQAGSFCALDVMAVRHFSGSGQLVDELLHGGEDCGFVGTVDVVSGVGHTDDLS